MSEFRDLSGQQFGQLTVIRYIGSGKYLCKCLCGKETEVYVGNLKSGHTKSCGCLRGEGIIGRKFGNLIVIKEIGHKNYLCLCECGNSAIRLYDSLMATNPSKCCCDKCGKGIRANASREKVFKDGTQPSKILPNKKPTKANKSGVVGVNWDKSRNMWQASLRFKGHKYNLGRYKNIQDAIDARRKAENEIFGEWIDSQKNKKGE